MVAVVLVAEEEVAVVALAVVAAVVVVKGGGQQEEEDNETDQKEKNGRNLTVQSNQMFCYLGCRMREMTFEEQKVLHNKSPWKSSILDTFHFWILLV